MSDYNYDEDFDSSFDDNDSGMEERATKNSFDTDTDVELNRSAENHSSSFLSKQVVKSPSKIKDNVKKTNKRDSYRSYTGGLPRRAESDFRSKRGIEPGVKGHLSARSTVSIERTTQGNAIKRVLSANRKKSTSLHNKIYELQQQCEALAIENRDLKRNVRIQDRDLKKLDGAEEQLPMMMKRHGNEVRVLEEKYRKQKEISCGLSENIKKVDNELLRTRDRLKECQTIIKENNLHERLELKNNILDMQQVLMEKDGKISELNRVIALEKKSHERLMKEKNEKYKKTMQKLKTLQGTQNDLQLQVREKEKALCTHVKCNKEKEQNQIMFSANNQVPRTPIYEQSKTKMIEIPVLNKQEESNSEKLSSTKLVDTMVSRNDFKDFSEDLNINVEPIFLTEGPFCTKDADIEDENKENTKFPLTDMIANTMNGVTLSDTNHLSEDEETYFAVDTKQPITTHKNDSASDSKKLLLAKMNAIDKGENPEYITENNFSFPLKETKKKAIPIFLQNSPKSITPMDDPETEMLDVFGEASKDTFSVTTDNLFSHVSKNSWTFKKSAEKNLPSISKNPNDLNNKTIDSYSMYSHFEEDYSPTVVGNNTNYAGKKSNRKGTLDNLFNQFEDPFSVDRANTVKEGSTMIKMKDEGNDKHSFSRKKARTPDDLEEMFII